jgi:low temperature requirement protein LtrA
VVGLVSLEAYEDLPGGLFAPLVLVVAYLVARLAHAVVFVLLSEPALRRRTLVTVALSVVPSGALLTVGALVGSPWQVWLGLAAVAIEPIVSYRTSAGVEWPVRSTTHFAERHGLIVILALGESILAIGAGVAAEPITPAILVGSLLSMLIAVALWWSYFSRVAGRAERALADHTTSGRARVATDGYTYLHLALVAGVVLAALGLEVAMSHIEDDEGMGLFGATALGAGAACYLAGTGFFARRVIGERSAIRFAGATLLVVGVPLLAVLRPIAALTVVAAALVALLVAERIAAATMAVRGGAQ